MKPPNNPEGQRAPPARGTAPASAASTRTTFKFLAVLVPFLGLLILEGALRIGGYGYSTSFWLRRKENGRQVLVENPKFGWRFFPPSVARSPLPLCIETPKPPNTVRILLLGESAAMGDPEPSYGLARQLQRMLQLRHPGKHIEVINLAMTAINSPVIREIARDARTCEADAWVIYAGNNEVIGPFGAGTVFGPRAASLAVVRGTLALKRTRTGQLLSNLLRSGQEPVEWQGMELFLKQQVPLSDPRMVRVYKNFEANMESVVRLARGSGARVILTTMAVNLDDCPPFGSLHEPSLTVSQTNEWGRSFSQGVQAEEREDYQNALRIYDAALKIDPVHAELHYRKARCELNLKHGTEATRSFELARDLDTLRFRADSRILAITRQIAQREQVPLADLSPIDGSGSLSMKGREAFYDHVHLNFTGNYQAAHALLAVVERELFSGKSEATIPTEQEIATALAFSPYDQRRVLEEMRARLQQPPFTFQIGSKERDARLAATLEKLRQPLTDSIAAYQSALAQASNDWTLHANYASLLEVANQPVQAQAEWLEVGRLMAHIADPWFHLGNLAQSAGHLEEAASRFQEALQRNPESTEALNGLGLVASDEGKPGKAIEQFEAALRINPRFSAARINRARELSRTGRSNEAVAEYKTVLASDSNNVPARINLGKLLADQGQPEQAIALYRAALQLKPNDPIAHFDLANSLASQGRHSEALPHYQAAVDQQPGFVEARYSLAMELTRAGRENDALPHLAEVVRLDPGRADARFNYGIALAKGRKFPEAAEQFREVLKLQPDHPAAQKALDRALQLMRQ